MKALRDGIRIQISRQVLAGVLSAWSMGLVPVQAFSLKGQLYLAPGQEYFRLLVKFRSDLGPDLDGQGALRFLRLPPDLAKSSALQAASVPKSSLARKYPYRRVVDLNPQELTEYRSPSASSSRSAAPSPSRSLPKAQSKKGAPNESGPNASFHILDFAGLMEVDAPTLSKEQLLALGREFEALDEVEYATLEPLQGLPPPVDLAPTTSDYSSRQNWQGPAPGSDCRYGWTKEAQGEGVMLRDIEDSWGNLSQDSTHEDFDGADVGYGSPAFDPTYDDHGMAIFGMILGQHNGYGIMGCAPKAAARGYSFQRSTGRQDRPGTLARMVADSKPGDIILLEMQAGGLAGEDGVPADVDVAIWDLVKKATEAGVVVLGTAGNGGGNLDGTAYAAYRARGDNGVIMVGAGSGNNSHTHLSFSSYGRCCVHVQGWGQNVVTTGYGDLAKLSQDNRQKYTSSFNGTSSAGGHLGGITAMVQGYAKKKLGRPLTSLQMRGLYLATGIPQGADSLTAHIGPLPNVRAILDSLDRLAAATGVRDPQVERAWPWKAAAAGRWSLNPHGLIGKDLDPGPIEAILRNVLGKEIFTATLQAGHTVSLSLPFPLGSGIYFLSLKQAGVQTLNRIVLLPTE